MVRRRAVRLAVTVVAALLVAGCAAHTATSTVASKPSTTSALAPTTTVPPLTAQELAWIEAVTKLHATVDKPFKPNSINMTRSKMVELGNALRTCSRELARIGSPSDRLRPVHVLVVKACRQYDRGARCFATAVSVSDASGATIAGTPQERMQTRAFDCGFAAQGNGANLLTDAEAKAAEIKANLSG